MARSALADALLLNRLSPTPPTAIVGDLRPYLPTFTQLRDRELGRIPGLGWTDKDFQLTGTSFLIQHEQAILADLMGYGKSKMFIDAVAYLNKFNDYSTLIICKASSIETWANEITKFAQYALLPIPYYGGKLGKGVAAGDVYIMSYAQYRINWKEISKYSWGVVALDEPQSAIRSASELHGKPSQIGERIHALKADRKVCITASPGLRHLSDFWNMLRWLDVEDMDWAEFEAYHLKVAQIRITPWTKRKKITGNTEQGIIRIKKMMQDLMCRRTNELDLPPCTVQDVFVPMSKEEAKLYREIEQISGDTATHSLRLATSNIKSKIDEAESYVQSAIAAGEKTIIFTRHLPTLRSLYSRFNRYGLAFMCGEISAVKRTQSPSARQVQIDRFQTDPSCHVLIATQQTGGEGLNLTAGSYGIFMDRSSSDEENQQAIKRMDRIGQTRPVKIFNLKSIIVGTNKVRYIERELDAVIAKSAGLIGQVVG